MALKTQEELLDELAARIRNGGSGGKTTAQDLREFLAFLTAEPRARDALIDGGAAPARPVHHRRAHPARL